MQQLITDPGQFPLAAQDAAGNALDAFRDKPLKIGRGRLAGERGVGHDDPGMVAVQRLVTALTQAHGPQHERAGNP